MTDDEKRGFGWGIEAAARKFEDKARRPGMQWAADEIRGLLLLFKIPQPVSPPKPAAQTERVQSELDAERG